jgi:hypothetical protein
VSLMLVLGSLAQTACVVQSSSVWLSLSKKHEMLI